LSAVGRNLGLKRATYGGINWVIKNLNGVILKLVGKLRNVWKFKWETFPAQKGKLKPEYWKVKNPFKKKKIKNFFYGNSSC